MGAGKNALTKTSKFLSYVLRHRPDVIGLTLDANGWASVAELIDKAKPKTTLSEELIREVVDTNDKQRFALSQDGQRIRASQGHSVNIELGLEPVEPPPSLYHGTATRFLESIEAHGLRPGNRQHVHLSADIETAIKVGQRHGNPVVLEVAAGQMFATGSVFLRSDNGVWLTEQVPVRYLQRASGNGSADDSSR